MNLLRLAPVARRVHNMGNDYDMRIPQAFQHIGLLGLVVIAASVVWAITTHTGYGIAGLLVGIVLILPAAIIFILTRITTDRRFNIRDGMVAHAALCGDEQILDVG